MTNKTHKKYNLTPDWLAGFTQSDGSFTVSIENQKKGISIRPVPVFNLTQSITELDLFLEIQKYLGVGKIYKNRNNVIFVVKSIEDLITVILPLFDKSQLRGSKLLSYNIFKKVVHLMKDKKHLTKEGTMEILNLSYFMNKDTTLRSESKKKLSIENLNLTIDNTISDSCLCEAKSKGEKDSTLLFNRLTEIAKDKQETDDSALIKPMTLEFCRGLIDGDGSFNVSFRTDRRRIGVNFTVVTELSSISVLNELVEFFQCGKVYNLPSKAARFQVQTVDEMLQKVFPKLKDIEFNTNKHTQFEKTMQVCKIINQIGFKTDEGLQEIVNLAWVMNKAGVKRKISKEEYLSKFISNYKIEKE